jgi:competence protein ComFC
MMEKRNGVTPSLWRRIKEPLLDVIFPRWCANCGGEVQADGFAHLCSACARDLRSVYPPACKTCGHPFFGILAGPRSCPHCAGLNPCFEEGRTLFLMRGPGREWLHQLKYNKGFYVLRDLQRLLRERPDYLDFVRGAVLVPVPLHRKKLRQREYNQSLLIAQLIVAAAGAPTVVRELLQRAHWTESQTRLSREARYRNMQNVFQIAPGALLQASRIHIVVDDVFTTGATVNACAQTLQQAGIVTIKVATMGHG